MAQREPVTVVVAEAKVRGDAEIRPYVAAPVQVRAGQPVEVRFAYDFEEASRAKESYLFRLESSIGNQREAPAEARFGDTLGLPDTRMGYVHQRYLLLSAGEHRGEFVARVEYRTGPWKGGASQTLEREAKGTFVIRVV